MPKLEVFSIAPWREVSGSNSRLAGVDLWGQKTINQVDQFRLPNFRCEGLIVGCDTI